MSTEISITEWFDPHNLEHMKAYAILVDSGMWPELVVPDNVIYPTMWQNLLAFRLAVAWMEYILAQIPVGE